MRGWKVGVAALMLWVSSFAHSFDFNSTYYAVYEMPGSNGYSTLYIVPKNSFLIIGVDQPTPIMFMPETTGFQATLNPDGSITGFQKVNYTANTLPMGAVVSSYKLFGGDFDGDGKADFFLQGSDAVRNSVVLTADATGTPQVYRNLYGALNSATYPQINVVDVDQNGRADIVATDTWGNVVTHMFDSSGGSNSVGGIGANTQILVGSINGKFRVDESGNSTYSVDVLTAAGTAGVAPRISLNYSSGAGDGVMGEGWSIGGLSAITRCRQTVSQDNNATAITLGASDRFCLDGQRLILAAGTYGASGSTYRTEIDSYAVVTANGGSIGNPAYFTVVRKDGSTSYYGNGNGSQLVLNGNGPVLTWAISRFQDSVGNPIRFSYLNDAGTNEQLINRIDYGYGTNKGATSNSVTYLQFNYENRPDASSGYVAGSKIQRTKRLKSIYSYNNGSEIRRYAPAYRTTDSVRYQSYVQQLFECVGTSCLSPTTFNWDLNTGGFSLSVSSQISISGTLVGVRTMDINGDGKADLVYMTSTGSGSSSAYTLSYQLSTENGFDSAQSLPANTITDGNTNWQIFDYNNDGKQDILVGNSGGSWKLFLGGMSGLSSIGTDLGISYTKWASMLDLNSDGLSDFVTQSTGDNVSYQLLKRIQGTPNYQFDNPIALYPSNVLQSPASCTPPPGIPKPVILVPLTWPTLSIVSVSDFQGDGRADIIASNYYNDGCAAKKATVAFVNNSTDMVSTQWTKIFIDYPSGSHPIVADFNGDGLSDVLVRHLIGGLSSLEMPWSLKLSTGTGGVFLSVSDTTILDSISLIPLDYNHDGYVDLAYPSSDLGKLVVRVYIPSAQSFDAPQTTSFVFQSATATNSADQYIGADVDGDGHPDLLRISAATATSTISIYKSADAGKVGNKITSIDNGFGNLTTITYKPLTDTSVYTKANDANDANKWPATTPPVFDIVAPSYVVASISSTAPRAHDTTPNAVSYGATSSVSYQYAGLKMQASGRGSLGFASITTTDNQTGVKTITTYNQTFPFIGQPVTTTLTSSTGLVFKTSTNTQGKIDRIGADATKYFQVYTPTVTELTKDPVGGWETSYVVTSTAQPDEWGNVWGNSAAPGVVVTSYASNHATIVKKMSTYNEYGSTDYDKQFARLSKTVVTHSRPGYSDITRASQFSYYDSGDLRGLLKTEQATTPDGSASVLKTYQYDQFGNKRCVSVGLDANIATNCTPSTGNRYELVNYDSAGRYVVDKQSPFKKGSAWAHEITEQVVTRNALGLPTQVNSVNGTVTNFTYDALGRESSRSDNTGAAVTTTYLRHGISGSQYNVTMTANTGAVTTQYFDALGRGIAKWQRGFDGRWIVSETEYDSIGRVKRQSVPHYDGETVYWATNTYDAFRLKQQQAPATGGALASSSVIYGASGDSTYSEITNALGQKRKEFSNAAGELVAITDNAGGIIGYSYDAAGQLTQTVTYAKQNGSAIAINTYLEYDQLGRKIKMRDLSKGTWFYQYNEFGDLTDQYKVVSTNNYAGTLAQAQADSNVQMQRTHIDYDKRGRMITRTDYRENGAVEGTSTWAYDSNPNGVGQVAQEAGGGLTRTYAYDAQGRPLAAIHANGNSMHILTTAYDNYGRPYRNTDALGTGSGTQNSYNSYGYLESVTDLASGGTLYSVQGMDARGNVISAIYGNGATTDWIYDQGSGLLTSQTTTSAMGVMLQRLDYTWDLLGNQKSRQDRGIQSGTTYKNLVQSFCYDTLNRLIKTAQDNSLSSSGCSVALAQQDQQYDDFGNITSKSDIGIYTYSATNPHQLQSTGDGVSYTYDKVGNLTADSAGRTLNYTVFDKVSSVSKGGNQITYAYGPDRNSYKRTDTTGSGITTTYTIGNVEKVVKPDGSYDMRRNLAGVALFTHHFNSSGTQTSLDKRYTYQDALGSLVLITDSSGSPQLQLAYNEWGERVGGSTDWETLFPSMYTPVISQLFTTRSFTGQEAMDAVGLINYGGRIYDPRLARFVQADPIVQDASDLQAYNRYAYVRSNPLTLTDPSGFSYIEYGGGPGGIDEVVVTAPPYEGCVFSCGNIAPTPFPGSIGSLPQGNNSWITPAQQCPICAMSNNFGSFTAGGVIQVGPPILPPVSLPPGSIVTSAYIYIPGKGTFDIATKTFTPDIPEPQIEVKPSLMSAPVVQVASGNAFSAQASASSWISAGSASRNVLGDMTGGKFQTTVDAVTSWWSRGLASAQSATLSDSVDKILQGMPPIMGVPARVGAAAKGAGGLSRAAEFGIKPYNQLIKDLKGTGLQAHHLIEQRFSSVFGQSAREGLSVGVTPAEHQAFTNAWRSAIPYGEGTANATQSQVMDAARQIYSGHPEILNGLGL